MQAVFGENFKQTMSFNDPVKAIAIDPAFARQGGGNQFVTGDTKLVLYEKGFLGLKTSVLHDKEGPITHINWKGPFIVWANDLVSTHAPEGLVRVHQSGRLVHVP